MKESYPASFTKLTPNDFRNKMLVWGDLFKDYPFEAVQSALKEYIMTNDTAFAPSPGQLNAIITKHILKLEPEGNMSKYEAWDLVLKTMGSGDFHYEPKETFEKLPVPVKKAIGSWTQLRKWSLQESGLEYVKRDFLERYQFHLEEEADRMRLPEVAGKKLLELSQADKDPLQITE